MIKSIKPTKTKDFQYGQKQIFKFTCNKRNVIVFLGRNEKQGILSDQQAQKQTGV